MIPSEIDLPGGVYTAELITDRRGARTWRVTRTDGTVVALKYATGTAKALAEREANVLSTLGFSGAVLAIGLTGDGAWLACPWFSAPTIGQTWKGVRRNNTPTNQTVAIAAAEAAAATLARLHARGWRHSDLQPDHILIDERSAHLLDFALAQGPHEVQPHVPYRGGLAHLAAPEVAAEILDTPADHHVTVTSAAEVYTFGALLFTIWAKCWPYEYGSERPSVADIYTHISTSGTRRPSPAGWPHMSTLIEGMMRPEPSDRPTMAQVCTTLGDPEIRQ